MADQVIVIKERRRGGGCGCLVALALCAGVVWLMHSCFEDMERTRARVAAEEAKLTPEEKAARKIAQPDAEIVSLKFAQAARRYMHDPSSYQAGAIRFGAHRDGYAYFHEFRGKNAFGAVIKDQCGLLCATNTGERVWTFYNADQLPELLKGVNTTK